MSSEESSCTDVGKFCMVSALAREVDRSKHRSVYRGERDRVDAYARPRWWCCSPHQLTLTLPLSTTSSLELLINYKTSVFRSSSHDLPTPLTTTPTFTSWERRVRRRAKCFLPLPSALTLSLRRTTTSWPSTSTTAAVSSSKKVIHAHSRERY